jgi:hypothetical protein
MDDFSPVEVFKDVVRNAVVEEDVPFVKVGPLSPDEQRAGAVSVMDAGSGADEMYLPLIHPRFQLRCIAPTLESCERLGRHVGFALTLLPARVAGLQVSNGRTYLVHQIHVTGGPSAHRDTEGTWEYLLFADTMMGTVPVPVTS